ncbi:LytTR family transcriptional regulator DNA-binding domain-containing protein [Pseudoxanthomonas sp. JBR18]|uniref:LytTR family transcriptional regulator DNA-binding domain-containing protein n=1 Tax=Pseudoxanthomonas sp. JBR18 TaxID=2969308 RepID=UPI002305BB93|nr:LytTR family transcriptional regulator DNA-binding domain-containing protein [Pseudoxanthomonas sp. JBR18]WCE04498.1 LytTR family transcriptional regulator DNA-binding domain-containing protein [Pseudoxanthomonas sp. JBR18]
MKQRNSDLWTVLAIFGAYTVTLRLALGLDVVGALLGGLANTLPVVIFGWVVRRIVVRHLIGKPAVVQLLAHALLCAMFMLLSYWLLIVLLGFFFGAAPEGFVVRPFKSGGAAWQSLQNLTTYALIAAVSYLSAQSRTTPQPDVGEVACGSAGAGAATAGASDDAPCLEHVPEPTAPLRPQEPEARVDAALSRYFVKIGDELRPLDIESVVSIGGAGDYAEVTTLTAKHLVRVTLAEFANSLDPTRYVRVHRSWIVNTDRIARLEPAGGGRLLLHLETGQTISTSREGASLLRSRVL